MTMQLNLRALDLNLLPVFDALMREQHLSRAAEQLAMSQPAVSNALKRLRQTFNDDLFVRTAKGLKPTTRAQELQQAIQPALRLIQAGCIESNFDPGSSEQTLQISLNSATEYLIAPLIHKWLQAEAPNIKLQLQPDYLDDIPAQLKEGRLDFALDYVGFGDQQFQSLVMSEEDLVIICRADHPQLNGKITLKQYETLPQVSLTPRSSLAHKQSHLRGTPIEQLMGKDLPSRNLTMLVSSFVSIPSIITQSDLIAIVPKRIAQNFNRRQQTNKEATLQCIALPFSYPKVCIQLLWHKSREHDTAHQWVRERMTKLIQFLPE